MGLSCTHGAFDGSYIRFDQLRRSIAEACGGSWMVDGVSELELDDEVIPPEHWDGAVKFETHSNSEGYFTPSECKQIAAFLEWVAPRLPESPGYWRSLGSQFTRTPSELALQFAKGCRLAARNHARLRFR